MRGDQEVVVVVRRQGELLVMRRAPERLGYWSLVAGGVEPGEKSWTAAVRELREETGLGVHEATLVRSLKRVQVFSHPYRSLRGRTITHAHFFDLQEGRLPDVKGGDDAAAAEWIPLDRLPVLENELFEDHFHVLDEFLRLT